MKSKDELKEIDIKNCICYYFDDIMVVRNIGFSDIFLDEKNAKNTSIYDTSCIIWSCAVQQICNILESKNVVL